MRKNLSEIQEQVLEIERIFNQSGYNTIRYDSEINPSFDLFVFNSGDSILTKVVKNIDIIQNTLLVEFFLISYFLKCIPLMIGQENRHNELENDTVYFRLNNNILAINLYTLKRILMENVLPYKIAKRGDLIVKINGEKLKRVRRELALSKKDIAHMLGISIRAVSQYENENMKIKLYHLDLLERNLKSDLKLPIDIFKIYKEKRIMIEELSNYSQNLRRNLNKDNFSKEIYELLENIGLEQLWPNKAPFDVIIKPDTHQYKIDKIKNEFLPLISTIISNFNQKDMDKIYFISQLLKMFKVKATAIVEDEIDAKQCKLAGIPTIEHKELKQINSTEEFNQLLKKRFN